MNALQNAIPSNLTLEDDTAWRGGLTIARAAFTLCIPRASRRKRAYHYRSVPMSRKLLQLGFERPRLERNYTTDERFLESSWGSMPYQYTAPDRFSLPGTQEPLLDEQLMYALHEHKVNAP